MKRILASLYGKLVGTSDDGRLIAAKGLIAGDYGNQFNISAPDRLVTFDDFDGATLSTKWQVAKGSDGTATNFAINGGVSGTILGTTGAGAGATMAVNGIQIASHLNIKANGGGVNFNTRVQMSAITNVAVFVGFTNQVAALQAPVIASGAADGLTFNAADCVGFMFDTNMATDDWWMVGNAASVAPTAQDTTFAPVAATYEQFAITLDTAGNASFYRNGLQVGITMPLAITPTVALTPVITAFARAAASRTVTSDLIYASMKRI